MRKALTAIIAFALVIGMTQCKKKNIEQVAANVDNGIQITLAASDGNGTKTDFDGTNFLWSNNTEYVNVGGSVSGYLGRLISDAGDELNNKRQFTGTISTPVPDENLYFFYLGNGDHADATTINIADQTGSISNVTDKHIAISECVPYSGQEYIEAQMFTKISIACFNTEGFVDNNGDPEAVYIHGNNLYTSVTINYNNGSISGNEKNYIYTGEASNKCYVALIPTDNNYREQNTTIQFESKSHHGEVYLNGGIGENVFYAAPAYGGGTQGLDPQPQPSSSFVLETSFSVAANKKVEFSKGNLQYKPNNSEVERWRFAPGVAHYTGNYNKNDGWNDLFSWGAWTTENPLGNAVSSWPENEFSQSLDGHDDWHTLTKDQWNYLFKTRENANKRYCSATVENKDGLIILPDNWCLGDVTPNTPFSANRYVLDDETWNVWENNGAVFLPAAGCYVVFSGIFTQYLPLGCIYWTSTYDMNYEGDDYAYAIVYYKNGNMNLALDHSEPDGGGTVNCKYSVRLVRDVE